MLNERNWLDKQTKQKKKSDFFLNLDTLIIDFASVDLYHTLLQGNVISLKHKFEF